MSSCCPARRNNARITNPHEDHHARHTAVKGILAAAALALGIGATAAQAVDITGAGATFPYPIYAKWAEAYKESTGIGMNYQSIGSGGGIKQIKPRPSTSARPTCR